MDRRDGLRGSDDGTYFVPPPPSSLGKGANVASSSDHLRKTIRMSAWWERAPLPPDPPGPAYYPLPDELRSPGGRRTRHNYSKYRTRSRR